MKQLLLLFCFALATAGLQAQVVYVDGAAADGGDGTTWATAFNQLQTGIDSAATGESVWIAQGTYTIPSAAESFFIDKGINLIGGFEAGATSADQSNPAMFETILSGDVNGDDGMAYDSLAAVDNGRVLFVTDTNDVSMFTVGISNLTVTNGAIAEDFVDGSLIPFGGAGLLTFAKVDVDNVNFRRNRSSFGSAITSLFATANGSRYNNITVEDNESPNNRVVYLRILEDIAITNSTFEGTNDDDAGMFFLLDVFDFELSNSTVSNVGGGISGGGIRAENCDDLLIADCTFDQVDGVFGGAIYVREFASFDAPDRTRDANDNIFRNLTITDCDASQRGGGMELYNINSTLENVIVDGCDAGAIGGGLYFISSADEGSFVSSVTGGSITNCTDQGAGGGVCGLFFGGTGTAVTFDKVDISNNESIDPAGANGGGIYWQGTSTTVTASPLTILNCTFEGNIGGFGNAILDRNYTSLTVRNTSFLNNGSQTLGFQGGGIVVYGTSGAKGVTIDSCTFEGNTVTQFDGILSGGGGAYLLGGRAENIPLTITNSVFRSNSSTDGTTGGGLYLVNGWDLTVDNNEFTDNSAGGEGGAFDFITRETSRDTADVDDILDSINVFIPEARGTVANSYFFNNTSGTQGGAIATQRVVLDLTNNIFLDNQVGADGAGGGAIIFNGNSPSFDLNTTTFNANGNRALEATLIHNTFLGNRKGQAEGAVGDQIAIFQPGQTAFEDSNRIVLNLLNNAFLNEDAEANIEAEPGGGDAVGDPNFQAIGDLTVNSLGGNYFNGDNGIGITLLDSDTETEAGDFDTFLPWFVDREADNSEFPDLTLALPAAGEDEADFPLLNGGVDSPLLPDTDIDGQPRVVNFRPDIGAHENQNFVSGTDEPIEGSGLAMSFFPNPTVDVVNITNETTTQRYVTILADNAGRTLKTQVFNGVNNALDLTKLPAGTYNLRIILDGQVYSKQIVKQ